MIFFISITLCFGDAGTLLLINGEDWIKWEPEFKAFFIIGFLTAHDAMRQSVANSNLPNDIKIFAIDFLCFPDDIKTMFMKVEFYYETTNNLEASIWAVIYSIYDKGWWNLRKNNLLKKI